MGGSRDFILAMLFVFFGMLTAFGLCVITPMREWPGGVLYVFIIVGGILIGQFFILVYSGIYLLLKRWRRK